MDALANDVGAPPSRVVKWRTRNRVPSEYWRALLDAAARRGIPATPELLVELSNRQREQGQPSDTAAA